MKKKSLFGPCSPRNPGRLGSQRGMALLSSMVMLVIISILVVLMYRGMGTQEKISGNMLEKERSELAALSAIEYAEWWIQTTVDVQKDLGDLLISCGPSAASSPAVDGNNPSNIRICQEPLGTPTRMPWPYSIEYKPEKMPVKPGGGSNSVSTAGLVGDVNYAAKAAFHIHHMGKQRGNHFFRITAVGYGASPSTTSVVQSVYYIGNGPVSLAN